MEEKKKEPVSLSRKDIVGTEGFEPEVVFKALSDKRLLQVQTEKEHYTVMEISGYDLQIAFNRDLLNDIADIESMLEGVKDLFRRLLLKDFVENPSEKTNETPS